MPYFPLLLLNEQHALYFMNFMKHRGLKIQHGGKQSLSKEFSYIFLSVIQWPERSPTPLSLESHQVIALAKWLDAGRINEAKMQLRVEKTWNKFRNVEKKSTDFSASYAYSESREE